MYLHTKSLAVLLVTAVWCCEAGRLPLLSLPLLDPRHAHTTHYKVEPWRPDGYHFAYETSLGNFRKETGYLVETPHGRKFLITKGTYSYIGPDGKVYRVNYVADENGFHPLREDADFFPTEKSQNIPGKNVESSTPQPGGQDSPKSGAPSTNSSPANARISETIVTNDDEGVDNRVGLPPSVIGSLLG